MKIFKGLFMVVCVCVMCVFNAGVADAENWIAKDSYGTAQWDADSVYSNDFGNIINFNLKFYNPNNDTITIFMSQIHKNEMYKAVYGRIFDKNGNVIEEGPMSTIYPIMLTDTPELFYDVVNYYQRYLK